MMNSDNVAKCCAKIRTHLFYVISAVIITVGMTEVAMAKPKKLKTGEGGVFFSYAAPDFVGDRYIPTFSFVVVEGEQSVEGSLNPSSFGKEKKLTAQKKNWPALYKPLQPGKYVIRSLYLYAGGSGSFCFNDGAVTFEVAEGTITYLGAISITPTGFQRSGIDSLVGHNGSYTARAEADLSNRDADLVKLPETVQGMSDFAPFLPVVKTFPIEGEGKNEIGRDCANAAKRR